MDKISKYKRQNSKRSIGDKHLCKVETGKYFFHKSQKGINYEADN